METTTRGNVTIEWDAEDLNTVYASIPAGLAKHEADSRYALTKAVANEFQIPISRVHAAGYATRTGKYAMRFTI